VYYLPNIEQGVDDLLDGLADIIFIRADLLENMQTQGLVTVSSFKVLAQVQQSVIVALHNRCYCIHHSTGHLMQVDACHFAL
jgi:hypothetical protein